MNLDLQWTQTDDQVIIKDVPLPFDAEGIEIKLTNATIRVVDRNGNIILQGITCGNIRDPGEYQHSHPGFIDIYLFKEEAGKKWTTLFREEVDPGVYISEVVAIGNYTAEEPIELTIRKGDTISVISKDESGWWKGKCKGQVGFFPSNYVREFPATPQTAPPSAPKKVIQHGAQVTQATQPKTTNNQPRQTPIATPGIAKAAQIPVVTNMVQQQPTPTPQPTTPKANNQPTSAPGNVKRPPSNSEAIRRSGPKIPISETLRPRRSDFAVEEVVRPNLVEIIGVCKTKYEYQATDQDELSFGVDEYIYIIEKDETGWWKGESSTNNVIGWFSSAYVEELSEEAAKQMFELNAMANLDEKEPVVEPQPVERKRTFSASMRENPRASGGGQGSPQNEKGLRTSGIQIHNPQPLNTSGTVKKDVQAAQVKAVEPTAAQSAKPVSGTGFSGSHRNSGGLPNANAVTPFPEETKPAPITNANTNNISPAPVKVSVNPTPTPAKTTVTATPSPAKVNVTAAVTVNNAQPKPSAKFTAITEAMKEVYNSVKAMKPSATWQKCSSDPYLGMQDPNKFAASFCSVTGETFSIGDSSANFPLSDIAWPLLFLMMREKQPAKVSTAFKVKEPTAYVVGLCDRALQNPFYFPGAYTMCSWLTEMPGVKYPWDRISTVLNYMSNLMQGYDAKNNNQFVSENGTNMPLQCSMADYLSIRFCFGKVVNMGTFLKEQNIITTATDVKELADIFNQVHAIEANTNILAVIAANLANNGTHILNKNNLAPADCVQETLSFMDACGLNNDSKDWQATVGFPAKSSQAGVIMAVIPNVGGLVVYAPALNVFGNSAKGTEFFKQLVQKIPDIKK